MNYTRIILVNTMYSFKNASNIEMEILGCFFGDIGSKSIFRIWALTSADGDICSGNCTTLEKENNFIVLEDAYSEEIIPTKLRMTVSQFVQLFDEWHEKAINKIPKQVFIKHEHGQFSIETSDEWDHTVKSLSLPDDQYIAFLRKNFEPDYAQIAMKANTGNYQFIAAIGTGMAILGNFFATGIGSKNKNYSRNWILTSMHGDYANGDNNATNLEREFDDVLLSSEFYREKMRMPLKQFVQLFDEWQEKVVKLRPKKVVIKHKYNRYYIEIENW